MSNQKQIIMTKVAKLVCVSLMTRVVVDEDATEEQIIDAAKHRFIDKLNTEIDENIESIEDDEECPYDPDLDIDLLNELYG
jgi:hypothetical protein